MRQMTEPLISLLANVLALAPLALGHEQGAKVSATGAAVACVFVANYARGNRA